MNVPWFVVTSNVNDSSHWSVAGQPGAVQQNGRVVRSRSTPDSFGASAIVIGVYMPTPAGPHGPDVTIGVSFTALIVRFAHDAFVIETFDVNCSWQAYVVGATIATGDAIGVHTGASAR